MKQQSLIASTLNFSFYKHTHKWGKSTLLLYESTEDANWWHNVSLHPINIIIYCDLFFISFWFHVFIWSYLLTRNRKKKNSMIWNLLSPQLQMLNKVETHLFFLDYLQFKHCYFYSLFPSLVTAEVRKSH